MEHTETVERFKAAYNVVKIGLDAAMSKGVFGINDAANVVDAVRALDQFFSSIQVAESTEDSKGVEVKDGPTPKSPVPKGKAVK